MNAKPAASGREILDVMKRALEHARFSDNVALVELEHGTLVRIQEPDELKLLGRLVKQVLSEDQEIEKEAYAALRGWVDAAISGLPDSRRAARVLLAFLVRHWRFSTDLQPWLGDAAARLLAAGVEKNLLDDPTIEGNSIAYWAAAGDAAPVLSALVKKNGLDILAAPSKCEPLARILNGDYVTSLQALLDAGLTTQAKIPCLDGSLIGLLRLAARNGAKRCSALLIRTGAEVEDDDVRFLAMNRCMKALFALPPDRLLALKNPVANVIGLDEDAQAALSAGKDFGEIDTELEVLARVYNQAGGTLTTEDLSVAAGNHCLRTCRALLELGCDPDEVGPVPPAAAELFAAFKACRRVRAQLAIDARTSERLQGRSLA
jgi:hypothetical protein